jgi:hypothetical protein
MPDITMCHGEGCVLKENCWRYLAQPNQYQSYFVGSPIKDTGECGYFLRVVANVHKLEKEVPSETKF